MSRGSLSLPADCQSPARAPQHTGLLLHSTLCIGNYIYCTVIILSTFACHHPKSPVCAGTVPQSLKQHRHIRDADYAFIGWYSSLCAPHPCVDGLSCDSQPPYVGGMGTSPIEQMRRLRLRDEVKDSSRTHHWPCLSSRDLGFTSLLRPMGARPPPPTSHPHQEQSGPGLGGSKLRIGPLCPAHNGRESSQGFVRAPRVLLACSLRRPVWCSARATVTWWLVQSPEPIPEGPTAVLALCPTVTLLPSGSLWRLPASLPPINHVCRIYFLQQFISANAIWVCPQVGRMLCCRQSHGARLYCQTDRHDSPAPPRQMHQSPRVGR